jgi:hypothetical protein
MRNYLQRVLSSGAATTSPARPPTLARPLIPPVAAPGWMPLGEGNLPALERTDLEQPAQHSGDSGERNASSAAALDGQTPEPEVARNEAKTSLVPPKQQPRLRASVDVADADSAQNQPSPESVPQPSPSTGALFAPPAATVIRAPKGLRRPAVGHERETPLVRAIKQTISTLAPRATTSATERAAAMPNARDVSSESRAEPPIQVRHKPTADGPAPVVSEDAAQIQVTDATVARSEIHVSGQPADPERLAVSTPQVKLRTPTEKLEPPSQQHARQMEEPYPGGQPLLKREIGETRYFELPVKPLHPADRSAPPASPDTRRRSQISIGRIDVQVNNVPAAPEPAARPKRMPPNSNFLEARYLNRFSLKP